MTQGPPNTREELAQRLRSPIAFTRVFKDLARFGLVPEDDADLERFLDEFVAARAAAERFSA